MSFTVPEDYRLTDGPLGSDANYGNNGAFRIGKYFFIASDEGGWEHVSVSLDARRCPTWGEMCWAKTQFWGPEDVVVQFHVAADEQVNDHEFCLHLWRPTKKEIPLPPRIFV